MSLPPDGRDFTRENDPKRGAELERRLAAAHKRVAAVAAGILGLDPNSVSVNARLIENCCGAGCQSCLLTKEAHAETWTGSAARPARDASR